jgi:citrate lyase subunit beta / citryl-CoA lyase
MAGPRTYLFVPGNRPERFAKALASGADAVVLDLEDAVAADAKAEARAAVGAWAATADPGDRARAVVRTNDTASPEHAADLRLIAEACVQAVMLPKAETAEQVAAVRAARPLPVLALIETARGVEQAGAVAAADGVTRLVFGTLDLALDLDLDIEQAPDGLGYAAGRLAVASRIAGLPTPVAGVTPSSATGPGCWPTSRGRDGTASAPSCASTRPRSSRSTPRWPRTPRPSRGRAGCWRPTARHPEPPAWTAA